MTIAYTHEGGMNHYSLLVNNSTAFGTTIFISSNCAGPYSVILDGQHYSTESGPSHIVTESGPHDLVIKHGNNTTLEARALFLFPVQSYQNFEAWREEQMAPTTTHLSTTLWRHELFISFVVITLAWGFSVYLVDKLAQLRATRSIVEEVK